MSARTRAFEALALGGTNALIANGLNTAYESVSAEQKKSLHMTDEDGVDTSFVLNGINCVATSKPSGCGEERITVLYNSTNLQYAKKLNLCATLFWRTKGITAVQVTLERKRGPYIMKAGRKRRICKNVFKSKKNEVEALSRLNIQPNGSAREGPFIF